MKGPFAAAAQHTSASRAVGTRSFPAMEINTFDIKLPHKKYVTFLKKKGADY
jgi:hypothetical protein